MNSVPRTRRLLCSQYVPTRLGCLLIGIMFSAFAGCAVAVESTLAPAGDNAISAGRERFEKNCAICHGIDAHGNGPFADLLNVKPPNLALLARAHGGDFPFTRIYRRIDGRDLPLAHGTSAMPIWGTRLHREGGDETYVRGRILEIILFLESIQEP